MLHPDILTDEWEVFQTPALLSSRGSSRRTRKDVLEVTSQSVYRMMGLFWVHQLALSLCDPVLVALIVRRANPSSVAIGGALLLFSVTLALANIISLAVSVASKIDKIVVYSYPVLAISLAFVLISRTMTALVFSRTVVAACSPLILFPLAYISMLLPPSYHTDYFLLTRILSFSTTPCGVGVAMLMIAYQPLKSPFELAATITVFCVFYGYFAVINDEKFLKLLQKSVAPSRLRPIVEETDEELDEVPDDRPTEDTALLYGSSTPQPLSQNQLERFPVNLKDEGLMTDLAWFSEPWISPEQVVCIVFGLIFRAPLTSIVFWYDNYLQRRFHYNRVLALTHLLFIFLTAFGVAVVTLRLCRYAPRIVCGTINTIVSTVLIIFCVAAAVLPNPHFYWAWVVPFGACAGVSVGMTWVLLDRMQPVENNNLFHVLYYGLGYVFDGSILLLNGLFFEVNPNVLFALAVLCYFIGVVFGFVYINMSTAKE